MAALFAVLRALRRAVQRDLATFQSVRVNNFFLFVALMVYGEAISGVPLTSAEPFLMLLGFLLLFPVSSDPLAKIPTHRLELWPLSNWQRIALRIVSFGLSPIIWITILIMFKTARLTLALGFLGLAISVQVMVVLTRKALKRNPHWSLLRNIPQLPGRLGGMIRNNFREMLSVLDPYVAILLSIGGTAYRFFSQRPDPAAFPILALLVALALSTYAQSLFGLDLGSGMTRYRLLPLRGWEILLAKDVAFLVILLVLVLPLSPAPGLTFGLAALAIGHHSSILGQLAQQRWRFTGGTFLPIGAMQGIGGLALGFAEQQTGVVVLILTGLGYLVSLYGYGRCWDQRPRP